VSKDWRNKYWMAKEFGWTLDYIESLAPREINMLVSAHNERVKEEERQIKKAQHKTKSKRW
jgi:hypothetical protein